MKAKLRGIPETLLIPLWARAAETQRAEPIIRDSKAVELVSKIDYDFSKFEKSKYSQVGVCIRTMILDKATQDFLDRHSPACVINLGAGLDTRHARLTHRDTLWYELDLPESIELRSHFFDETENYRFISKSAFDISWFEDIDPKGRSVLFIAEGILMYFEEKELKPLFASLADSFSGARSLIEVQGPGIVGKSKRHDSLKKMENAPEFKWGTSDSETITKWHPGIEVAEEWSFFDYHLDRMGWFKWLLKLSFFRAKYEPRIVHLKFR